MSSQVAPESIQRVALVNFGGIGDEILFSPVIDAVRDALPEAHLTLILEDRSASSRQLLNGLNEVIPLSIQGASRPQQFFRLLGALRSQPFDAVISSGSSPFIALALFLSGIRLRVGYYSGLVSKLLLQGPAPLNQNQYAGGMYYSLAQSFINLLDLPDNKKTSLLNRQAIPHLASAEADALHWAEQKINEDAINLSHKKQVLIHPGSSLMAAKKNILKAWPAASWARLIEELSHAGHRVYLVGGPDDKQTVEDIREALKTHLPLQSFYDYYGQTKNLQQLLALMQLSDLVISVDSAPLHIAIGLGKPVVAMFGPTNEAKLVPEADHIKVITVKDLSCRPCLWHIRQTSCEKPVCLDVSVSGMLDAAKRLLH